MKPDINYHLSKKMFATSSYIFSIHFLFFSNDLCVQKIFFIFQVLIFFKIHYLSQVTLFTSSYTFKKKVLIPTSFSYMVAYGSRRSQVDDCFWGWEPQRFGSCARLAGRREDGELGWRWHEAPLSVWKAGHEGMAVWHGLVDTLGQRQTHLVAAGPQCQRHSRYRHVAKSIIKDVYGHIFAADAWWGAVRLEL
jgi:hypothetical protein